MPDSTVPQVIDPREQPTLAERSAGGTAACPVVQRVGDYELLYELGRGGMGVVFKARDVRLNRFVAVKMILPAAMPDETDLERFRPRPRPPRDSSTPTSSPSTRSASRTAGGSTAWT